MPVHGTLENARSPVKLWTPLHEVESQALEQLRNIANLPFVFKHVAAMPDVHLGKGATVGSVIAMKAAVVPAAVGVDIGCGMAAVKTNLTSHDFGDGALTKLRRSIVRAAAAAAIISSRRRWSSSAFFFFSSSAASFFSRSALSRRS